MNLKDSKDWVCMGGLGGRKGKRNNIIISKREEKCVIYINLKLGRLKNQYINFSINNGK